MKVSVKDIKYDYGNFIVKGPQSYSLPAQGIPVSDLSQEVQTAMQKSYNTFSHNWTISSVKNLCDSVIADSDAEAGMVYYGKFTGEGLPSSLRQAEMTVEIIADDNSNGKSLVLTVFSADTAPYKWEAQYVKINGNYPSSVTWRAYQQQITSSNKLSASLVSGLPTVPTKVSQLTNDVPYIKEDDLKVPGTLNANGHAYVDLGLPSGTLWASTFISDPQSSYYDNLFAWGETEALYNRSGEYSVDVEDEDVEGTSIAGTQYDAAHVLWGGNWQMPTYEDAQELINYTNIEYVTDVFTEGDYGYKLTSTVNDNYIYIMCEGQMSDGGAFYPYNSQIFVWLATSSGENYRYILSIYGMEYVTADIISEEATTGLIIQPVMHPPLVDKYATREASLEIDSIPKTSDFNASVGNYYFVNVPDNSNIVVGLITPEDNTKISQCKFLVTTLHNSGVQFNVAGNTAMYVHDISLSSHEMYEITATWNGYFWTIISTQLTDPNQLA